MKVGDIREFNMNRYLHRYDIRTDKKFYPFAVITKINDSICWCKFYIKDGPGEFDKYSTILFPFMTNEWKKQSIASMRSFRQFHSIQKEVLANEALCLLITGQPMKNQIYND
jgi:hypothetical protein